MTGNDYLTELIASFPHSPGIYIMYNSSGNIIYIGKAIDLKKRVASYFKENLDTLKTKLLTAQIADIKFIVTSNEIEAFILEDSYIKQHKPKYNIRLKDDKRYPYIALNVNEPFPRLLIMRRALSGGFKFFGPFPSNHTAHKIISILNDMYKMRRCKLLNKNTGVCLYYHIKKCGGPCAGEISEKDYSVNVNEILKILAGQADGLLKKIEHKMLECSELQKFEEAADYRDKYLALKELLKMQKIDSGDIENYDIIGCAHLNGRGCIQKFVYRLGKMAHNEVYDFEFNGEIINQDELFTRIIFQAYRNSLFIPPEIIIEHHIENHVALENWLSNRRGAKTKLTVPLKGKKQEFIEFVKKNCFHLLEQQELKIKINTRKIDELKESLQLSKLPVRIHAFDISNFSGTDAVGSAVSFYNGLPAKNEYRKYKIKTVEGSNDYAMMDELLTRHFKHIIENSNSVKTPDLALIDGGRQHLNIALSVIRGKYGISKDSIEIISLAKENEEIFKENHADPILLQRESAGLRLLQFIRDEAHRFGVSYHQNIRDKKINLSVLDSIKGIGQAKKERLISFFKSIQNIKYASLENLCKIEGIDKKLGLSIIKALNEYEQ